MYIFDAIAGIGVGGWLALFFGRFHMNITACLTEWYNLIQIVAPRSQAESTTVRLLQHSYYDTGRLVNQVNYQTKVLWYRRVLVLQPFEEFAMQALCLWPL